MHGQKNIKLQISMPTTGFEPTIPRTKRSQTHPLDRTATGISSQWWFGYENMGNINLLCDSISYK